MALVAIDVGGTNVRFARTHESGLFDIRSMLCADFPSLAAALAAYLDQAGLTATAASIAVAGPVQAPDVDVTNNHWHFSKAGLLAEAGLDQLLVVNDFTAQALAQTDPSAHGNLTVLAGNGPADAPLLVIGPGTGLGVAALMPLGSGSWRALPGEGGHVDLPVADAHEVALWQMLFAQLGHVRAEDVLSGGGLLLLYRAACALAGLTPRLASPAEVTAAALVGDHVAVATLEQFCVWLGRVAGNNVLTLGARGGVYIVGGVVPRFADFFAASGFARGFTSKGCMSGYLADVPVWLVTADYPGLEGAGVALEQALVR